MIRMEVTINYAAYDLLFSRILGSISSSSSKLISAELLGRLLTVQLLV